MPRVLVAGRLHEAGRRVLDGRSDIEYEVLDSPTAADLDARIADIAACSCAPRR